LASNSIALEEEKEQETNRLLGTLIETSPASIIVHDFEGNFLYVNQKTLDLHGYSREEFLKLKLQDIDVPESAALIRSRMEDLKQRGEISFEVQHFRKNGTRIPLLVNVKQGNWSGKDLILSIATDITRQKWIKKEKDILLAEKVVGRGLAEKAQHASEEKYHSLVENIPDVIWTSDENGNTPYISESVTKIFGFTPEEIVADPSLWFGRIHKNDLEATKSAYAELIKHNKLFDIEYRLQRKDGTWIWVYDRAAKTYEKGNIKYVDGVFRDITEHKRMEEALQKSEAYYRSLFENSFYGIVVIGPDFKFQQVNAAFCNMLEYRKEELVGKMNIGDVTHPEDMAASEEMLEKLFRKELDHFVVEKRYVAKSGRILNAMNFSQGIYDNNGHYISGTASILDITDRKQVEEELRKYRDRLEELVKERTAELEIRNFQLIEDISERKDAEEALRKSETRLKEAQILGRIGSWEIDIEKQEIAWSDQTYRLYDRDPALGPPTPEEEAKYYTKEQGQRLREYARRAILEGKNYKYDLEATLPSGRHVFFSATMKPIKDAGGLVVKLFGTVQDISERKKAEEALRASEERYRLLFEKASDLILVLDVAGRVVNISPSVSNILEFDPWEIVGKRLWDVPVSNPDDIVKVKEIFTNFNKDLPSTPKNYEMRTKTGRTVVLEVVSTFIVKDGQPNLIINFARDISARKREEEKLRQIEQERQIQLEKTIQISELKSNLIMQAAHELKTPLTSIFGWTELLYNAKKQGKSLDTTFDLEDFESILRNSERLENLISNFLDVGRIESGKIELVRLKANSSEILENAIRTVDYLATQKGITFTREMAPSVNLSVDRRRMEQALINILSNAIKYSPEKTRVTIKTNIVELNARKMFRVQVIDEGYGFTTEELPEATTQFGKAYTRQEQKRAIQGTGLGLYITRRIIEQHSGTLEIRSDGANLGTQIEILLPLD